MRTKRQLIRRLNLLPSLAQRVAVRIRKSIQKKNLRAPLSTVPLLLVPSHQLLQKYCRERRADLDHPSLFQPPSPVHVMMRLPLVCWIEWVRQT